MRAAALLPGRARPGRVGARLAAATCLLALLAGAGVGPADAQRLEPVEPLIDGPLAFAQAPPQVDADAWVLMDVATGQVLAEHQADQRRPVASTIKILTALTVLSRADLDDRVTVGEEVLVGGASVDLRPGDEWTVEQLLDALIARSGNDAAEALAVHVAGDMEAFVELMAEDARALGLGEVVLTEASGLADGNELSARDLAVLSRVALSDPEARPLFGRAAVDLPGVGTVASRNELLDAYPGATGVKTGYTAAAGFGLVASAERGERELIAVVLDAGEDPGRFQDAIALLDHGFEDYEPYELTVDWSLLVAGGQQSLEAAIGPVVVPRWRRRGRAGTAAGRGRGGRAAGHPHAGRARGRRRRGPGGQRAGAGGGHGALGRALIDQVHRGMRRATAEQAW
jgi:serine-type D-Ala-D-Ala carboxypeptidase (penicillin-binding protein 5/6)